MAEEHEITEGPARAPLAAGQVHPISAAQRGLWFLEQLSPETSLFVLPIEIALTGPVSPDALNRAVAAVVARHPPLRWNIEQRGDDDVLVERPWPLEFPIVDLTARGEGGDEGLPVLSLRKGQMFAARLIRQSPRQHTLQLAIHHMVFDGASTRILVDELSATYTAARAGNDPLVALPPLPASYLDIANRQARWADSIDGMTTLASCQLALNGVTDLDLATDRPRNSHRSLRSASEHLALGPALATEITRFSTTFMITPFITLCAAFGVTISRRAGGNRDFALAVPHHGRTSHDETRLIGLFSNTAPLRVRLPLGITFTDLVATIRDETSRVLDDGRMPFDRIVAALRPQRDLSRLPLCPVSFQKHYDIEPATTHGDITFHRVYAHHTTSQFELSVSVGDGTGLDVLFEYSTDLFNRDTIQHIATEYRTICADLIAHPHRPVDQAG